MLNSLFPRDTWAANLSKVCFAEWKHPFPRWPDMSVSPLVMNIPWLHDRSLAGSAGDMWRLKPAATFAVRLRFPRFATIALPRRDRPLDRHSWSGARLAWKQRARRRRAWERKSIIVGRFCTSVLWCIFVLCHHNWGILKYPHLFLFYFMFFICFGSFLSLLLIVWDLEN